MTARAQRKCSALFEQVGEIELPAVARFDAPDHFKVGGLFRRPGVIGGRKVGWVGDNFRCHFGSMVEENIPPRHVRAWRVVDAGRYAFIVTDLGGVRKAEVSLAHVPHLMGHTMTLMNGCGNVAHVRSLVDGRLWAVRWLACAWYGQWSIEAYPLSFPFVQTTIRRVFGG